MKFTFFASYLAIWILVLFQGLLVLALLRQLAELRRLVELGGLHGEDRLPAGSLAPEFAGIDVRSGREVTLQSFSEVGGVLLFLVPDCNVCNGLANSIRPPVTDELPPVVVFCQDTEGHCAPFRERLGAQVHLLGKSEETAERYQVFGSPTAIVIDGELKIRAYGHPQEIKDLKQLVARSLVTKATTANLQGSSHLDVLGSPVVQ